MFKQSSFKLVFALLIYKTIFIPWNRFSNWVYCGLWIIWE